MTDFDKMSDTLESHGLCAQTLTQDDVVKQRELDRLNSEQLALLDMLITMQAQVVGGSYWSLTTLLVRELRYVWGGEQCVQWGCGVVCDETWHHQHTGTCGKAYHAARWCA